MWTKDLLAQIILDFQEKRLPETLEREIQIPLSLSIQRAVVIMGPRRAGKTFCLFGLMRKLLNQGIEKQQLLYLNLENPKLAGLDLTGLIRLLEMHIELYPQILKKKKWIFLDEPQNVPSWEKAVREMLDREQTTVFLSGSSSKLLSREIATSMRGRSLSFLVLPFSFPEFLKTKNLKFKKYYSSAEKALVANALNEYLSFGGYPETVLFPSMRDKIIDEIIETTIYQDLVERHNLRNIKILKLMFNALVSAKEFSLHKFYNFLKSMNIKLGKNTIYQYLDYFEEAFIFFPLRRYAPSLKTTEQSQPKIYTVDNGLIERIMGNDKGKKWENFVFLTLIRLGYVPNKNLFYYLPSSGSGEVDFLVKEGKKTTLLLQACYDETLFQTREREWKALKAAGKELYCRNLRLITPENWRDLFE